MFDFYVFTLCVACICVRAFEFCLYSEGTGDGQVVIHKYGQNCV